LRKAGRAAFLLESVERGRLGRHSLVGCGSHLCYLAEAEACGEPVVGYLSYDYAARLEPTVPLPSNSTGLPESRFLVADVLVRFDHALGTAEVIRGDPEEVSRIFARPAPRLPAANGRRGFAKRTPGREEYESSVRAAQEHIRAGDAFQIVLSQRAERPTTASALDLYRALRHVNPSPYLFLLELDGLALIGSSPETLVKCQGRCASLNPIAGSTRPGEGDAERLLASEKDRAEHVMLVDLGRNDLSRVCVPGSPPASRSGRSCCTTAWRCSRRAPGSSPTPTRPPSTRSACASSPLWRPRSTSRRRADGRSADRQLRLVHVQPGASLRRARRG